MSKQEFLTIDELIGGWQKEVHQKGYRFPADTKTSAGPPPLRRGDNGEAVVQPDQDGEWRYVYEGKERMLDHRSTVNFNNPYIKLEPVPILPADQSSVSALGKIATAALS